MRGPLKRGDTDVSETGNSRRFSFALLICVCFLAVSCGVFLEQAVESPLVDGGDVTFILKSPAARTVQVAGDWNNWGRGDAESGEVLVGLMERDEGDGLWKSTLKLEPGRYRYRFLINESYWILDPNNPRVIDDTRGGKANLLIMP